MKAWFLVGPESMEQREIATAEPGPCEALVWVRAVGVCGSDAEAYVGTHPLPNYPRLPGHEFAGVVARVGERWEGPAVGTRVAADPAVYCGECYACRAGRHNCCAEVSIAGVHRPGALAEYVVCGPGKLYPIPDEMSFETAAMVETLSIGSQAVSRAGVSEGDQVVVLGAGSIGLCCLMMARLRGGVVLVSEPLAWRRELAAELGAEVTVDPGREPVAVAVEELTKGYGANVVIDATGEVAGTELAFSLVGSAGRVVILTLSEEAVPIRPWELVRKELTVMGSRLSLANFGELVQLAASGKAPIHRLATHRYPFAEAERAFAAAAAREEGLIKATVALEE